MSLMAVGLLILASGTPAFAESTPAPGEPNTAHLTTNTPPQNGPTTMRASDMRSLAVYGTNNEKLGDIVDLVLDPTSGKIRYSVLSFGGILGMGEKYFAVPWGDVKVFYKGATSAGTQREVYCTVDVSKEALKNAPGFDKSHWPDFADAKFTHDIEAFYGTNRTADKVNGENR
jgi:sporulation protein YlmC with PRC-barrel domain